MHDLEDVDEMMVNMHDAEAMGEMEINGDVREVVEVHR